MSGFPRVAPIRLILFDAFDTLVTPRSAPHLQYAAVARQYGLDVSNNDVKAAFKQAFRTTSVEHPNYGLETDIASPDEWWKLVIQRTFSPRLHSGITSEQYATAIEPLSQRLVTRFGTSEAYNLFEDVVPTLERLAHIQAGKDRTIRLALATNSDSRILSVLKSFDLDRFLELDVGSESSSHAPGMTASGTMRRSGPTLSYFEKSAKPDSGFFEAAIRRASSDNDMIQAANVLYVGDQLHEDFWGATDAGLQAAWLQRTTGLESNQPYQQIGKDRSSEQEQAFVRDRTIPSLSSLIDIVTRSN